MNTQIPNKLSTSIALKKILFLAISAATVSAYALPTYEPFTEFASTIATNTAPMVATTLTGGSLGTNANYAAGATNTGGISNVVDLATGGYTAPSGEAWGELAFSGTWQFTSSFGAAYKGVDTAVASNSSIFPYTGLTNLLPTNFPGMPSAGGAINYSALNSAQPSIVYGTNKVYANYPNIVGNSAVLKFAQDFTRPTNGTKTLYFSYLFNLARKGQTGTGNSGRYLSLVASTNLVEGTNVGVVAYTNWNAMFNTFAVPGPHYISHGVIAPSATSFIVGGCDSSKGLWSTASGSTPTNSAAFGVPVFIIGAYTMNATNGVADINSMWVNPAQTAFGGATAPTPGSSYNTPFNMSDLGGLVLENRPSTNTSGGVDTNYIANLMVGSTWSYVTGGPEFTAQPASVNATANANVSFTSAATAAGQTVSYQWYKVTGGVTNIVNNGAGGAGGSATVSGANTATLSLNGVSPGDVGTFEVEATASGTGFSLSSSASLIVDPYITVQPQNVTANYGNTASITATAFTGQPTLSYQWYEVTGGVTNLVSDGAQSDGSVVSGASGTVSGGTVMRTLSIAGVTYQESGLSYFLYVTNNVNNAASSSLASLTVNDPYIITEPANDVVVAGGNATFTVSANGTPTLTYQWYANGAPLSDGSPPPGGSSTVSGSQTATLTLTGVQDADAAAGPYYVTIFGGSGLTTNSVNVTLTVADPVVTVSPPASRTERVGDHTAFVIGATGNALSYQWSHNSTPIVGATSSALVLTNIQTGSNGTYSVTVSNINSSASASATLDVINSTILPIASTNVVVARVGDGAQSYSAAGNTIYLDQYTTNGVYVSTVQVPDENTGQSYGTGSSATVYGSPALLAQGGVGSDGANSLLLGLTAANQEYLNFAGYCAQYPFNGADVTVGGTAFLRGLASINAFGVYSLTYTNEGLYSGGNHTIREALTLDGTNFWTTGQAGANGVKFANTTVASYATGNGIPVIASSATGTRSMQIVLGIFIFSDVSGASGPGLYACTNIPEPLPSATVPSAQILNEGGLPNDFAFSPDGQTVYIADSQAYTGGQAGGIQRWDTNTSGPGWVYSYTLPVLPGGATNGAQGLTVYFPPNVSSWGAGVTGAVLYATSYGDVTNSLSQTIDTGAGSTPPTVIATAGPNQALRGVRFGPQAVPVSIASQPASQTNFPNNNVTFSTAAIGSQPIYYQWQFNGTNIPGATQSTFTTNNISFASAGNYSCVVTNLIPSTVTTSNALLTVTAGAPVFTTGVPSFVEGAGDHLAFVAQVTGSQPISAQWYFSSLANPIPGATNTYLVLTNIQMSNSGPYLLYVSNLYGTAHSSGALVVSATPVALSSNNLVVARIGDGVQALSGVTGNTIYLDQYTSNGAYVSSLQIPDEGTGTLYETGSTNSVGTTPGLLVGGNNTPANDAALEGLLTLSGDGQTLDFAGYCQAYPFAGPDLSMSTGNGATDWRGVGSVNAFGDYNLAYTNTGLYSGGAHVIHSAITLDQTNYWTTGEAGSVGVKYVNASSAGASYANGSGIPAIGGSDGGTRQIHLLNGNLIFSDSAGASGPGIYEFSGAPETPATAALFLAESNSPMDFAISPDQQTIYVADNSPFVATNVPGGGIQRWDMVSGAYALSYVLSTGTGLTAGARGLTVDFRAQSTWGPGVIGAKLYATTSEASGNRFIKIVDNGSASAVTTIATAGPSNALSGVSFGPVILPVAIASQPQSTTALVGTGAEFSVGVTGTAPFYYQWQFNGTNLVGASASSLTVGPAQAALPGNYSVTVSNLAPSSVTSDSVYISFVPVLGFNTNGSGWSMNGTGGSGLPLYGFGGGLNIVALTQGVGEQASSTFNEYPVYVGGFLATWTYQVVNPTGTIADGMAFVIQNDLRGAAALGDANGSGNDGGSLGYGGTGAITNSVALEFNLYTNAASGAGIALDTDGAIGPNASTSPVVLGSGDPINVTVQYLNGIASVTLFDTVTSNTFTTNAAVDVPAVVGGNQAYVGFTGADGGSVSTQTVSNFVYISLVDLSVAQNGANTLAITWPAGVGAYSLQSASSLAAQDWAGVPNAVSIVNGSNMVTVPLTGGNAFYRLTNSVPLNP